MDGTLREASASSAMLKYFESVFGARLAVGYGRWVDGCRARRVEGYDASVASIGGVGQQHQTTAQSDRARSQSGALLLKLCVHVPGPLSPSLCSRRLTDRQVRIPSHIHTIFRLKGNCADDNHHRSSKGGRQLSRKEARKQEREGRKQRKAQFYTSHGAPKPSLSKRAADHEHPDSPQRKRSKLSQPESNAEAFQAPVNGSKTAKPIKAPTASKGVSERETPLEKASRRADSTLRTAKAKSVTSAAPVVPRSRQEEEDDAYIAYLESKLGYRKGGKRTTKYGKGGDDGLDGAWYLPRVLLKHSSCLTEHRLIPRSRHYRDVYILIIIKGT